MELRLPFDCDEVENAFGPLDLDDELPCDFISQVQWFEKTYGCSLIRTDTHIVNDHGKLIEDMYFQFWSESDLILFLLKWSK